MNGLGLTGFQNLLCVRDDPFTELTMIRGSDNMLSKLKGDDEWKEIQTSVKSTITMGKFKRNYYILLFLTIPCLVLSEQCKDGKLICTEGKRCCSVNGIETCCEFKVQGEGGSNVLLLAEATYENFSNISINSRHRRQSCIPCPKGGCCPRDYTCCGDGCCRRSVTCCNKVCCSHDDESCCGKNCCAYGSQCCSTGVCCPHPGTCCPLGQCCPYPTTCCNDRCCPYASTCCPRGQCCSYNEKCCGENCCPL